MVILFIIQLYIYELACFFYYYYFVRYISIYAKIDVMYM